MRPSTNRLAAAGATVATAVAGGLLTDPTSAWFEALRKPPWYPPPATFGVVWTGLYAGMAWAGGEVLERGGKDRRPFARAALLNLVMNAGWTAVFFRAHRPAAAAAECALLTVSTADLVRRAGQVSPAARAVLIPYAIWTGFATALSADIARRNR
jgi:translocator protein